MCGQTTELGKKRKEKVKEKRKKGGSGFYVPSQHTE